VINAAGLTGSPNTQALEFTPGSTVLMDVNLRAPTELIRFIRSGVVPGTRFLQVGSAMIFTEGTRKFHGDIDIGDRMDLSYCLYRNALERIVRDPSCNEEARKKVLYLR
jgi:predicted metal-binding protein